jgi:hypothetical protein
MHRVRDLDCGEFGSAGIELGDDLQYGRALLGHKLFSGGKKVL